MSTFATTLALDGSADPVQMDLVTLAVGDQEQRQLLIDGFETGDSGIVVTLIAKTDFVDDDDDPDTIQIVATLTTPSRAPNSRLATFVFSSDDTRELALGRIHRVQVALTRSAVAYAKTVATGFVAATQPGSTITAPSDEATLRAAGDATVLSAITDKIDSVSGTANRITIGGTATAPTVDIASTYGGQASINTLGTVTTGVWNGSAIDTAHTAAKVVAVAGVTDHTSIGGTASNPTVDIASTYPGQTSITTLGNVGTGTWNATTIAANKGGTGLTGFGQAGALLIAASIAALAVLNPNVTATKKFLNQVGDGAAVTATAWSPIVSADVSDATSTNVASRVMVRDASGNVAANNLTVATVNAGSLALGNLANTLRIQRIGASQANLLGDDNGFADLGVRTIIGDLVGNAATATKLLTARTINGVNFDGSGNITVTAAAGTLSGSTIAATVTASSLTSVGTLTSLAVTGIVTLGNAIQLPGNGAAGVQARNASNSAYVDLLFLNASDVAVIPRAAVISTGLTVAAGTTAVQALTATTGAFSGAISTSAGHIIVTGGTNPYLDLDDGSGAGFIQIVGGDINISPRSGKAFTVSSDVNVAAGKFTISASTGNTIIAGTLAVTGALTGTTGAFTAGITQFGEDTAIIIDAATSNSRLGLVKRSGLAPSLSFRTDSFVINRVTSGSLVSGAQSAVLTLSIVDGSASFTGDLAVNTNKFTVTAATGNTTIAGSLAVSGGLTVSGGAFAAGGQVFTSAAGGVFVAGKTGSATDFILTNGAGQTVLDVPTGLTVARFVASTTAAATIRLPHGAAPTSPVNGDVWTTTAGIFARINGVTVGPLT